MTAEEENEIYELNKALKSAEAKLAERDARIANLEAESKRHKSCLELAMENPNLQEYLVQQERQMDEKDARILVLEAEREEASKAMDAGLVEMNRLNGMLDVMRERAEKAEAEFERLQKVDSIPPFEWGESVIVNNPRYHGPGVVMYDTGARKRMVAVLLSNDNTWEYEVETVSHASTIDANAGHRNG